MLLTCAHSAHSATSRTRSYLQLIDAVESHEADGKRHTFTAQIELELDSDANGAVRMNDIRLVGGDAEFSRKCCQIESTATGMRGELHLPEGRRRAAGEWSFVIPPGAGDRSGTYTGSQGGTPRSGRAEIVAVFDVSGGVGRALRAWVPAEEAPIRGLFIWGNRATLDDRCEVMRDEWLGFCRLHRFALLALAGFDYEMGFIDGRMLRDQIAALAARSGHAELERVPVLFTGHSNGGMKAWEYNAAHPGRVIAFTVSRAAMEELTDTTPAARANPAMLVVGVNDNDYFNTSIARLFTRNRREGAPWSFVVERNAGHELGRTPDLWLPFFDWAVRTRLDATVANASGEVALRPIDPDEGWLLVQHRPHPGQPSYGPARTIEARAEDTSWFPSRAAVLAHLGFVSRTDPLQLEIEPARRRYVVGEMTTLRVRAFTREEWSRVQFAVNGNAIGEATPEHQSLTLNLDAPGVFVVSVLAQAADSGQVTISRPVSWVVEPRP